MLHEMLLSRLQLCLPWLRPDVLCFYIAGNMLNWKSARGKKRKKMCHRLVGYIKVWATRISWVHSRTPKKSTKEMKKSRGNLKQEAKTTDVTNTLCEERELHGRNSTVGLTMMAMISGGFCMFTIHFYSPSRSRRTDQSRRNDNSRRQSRRPR